MNSLEFLFFTKLAKGVFQHACFLLRVLFKILRVNILLFFPLLK